MKSCLKRKMTAPILLSALLMIMTVGCGESAPQKVAEQTPAKPEATKEQVEAAVEEDGGDVTSKEDMLLEMYAANELPKTFARLDASKEYEAVYVPERHGMLYRAKPAFEEHLTGIVSHSLADTDGDGVNELVAFFLQENHLQYLIFKVQGEDVVGSAVLDSSLDDISGTDYAELWTFLQCEDGKTSLVEMYYKSNAILDHAFSGTVQTFTYDGQTYRTTSSELKDLADFRSIYAKNRASLDEAYDWKDLFYMMGQNTAAEKNDGLFEFFPTTGDASALGTVAYRFAKGIADFRQSNSPTAYTTEKISEEVVCPDGTKLPFSFEKVVFSGKNEKRIADLNARMDAVEASFLAHVEDTKDQIAEFEEWGDGDFDIDLYLGENVSPYSVYFDEEGNVSVAYLWSYVSGNVYKTGESGDGRTNMNRWVCVNTNMQLGKKQTFFQMVDGGWQYLQDAIYDDLCHDDGFDAGAIEGTIEGMYDFNFFYNKDSVYVCFDSFDIDGHNPDCTAELARHPKEEE